MTIERMGQHSDHPVDHASATVGAPEKELTKFLDPLRIPPVIKAGGDPLDRPLKIAMKEADVRMHSDLPPSRMWTYEGHFPGPTIEVRRGQKLRVAWRNDINGPFPLKAVDVMSPPPPGAPVQPPPGTPLLTLGPGRDGVEPRPEVAALPSWLVVHLHGTSTGGGNDGWTENAQLYGETQLAEYHNDQRATALWYHDHAMAITALNVVTGLAGMYIVRDDEEDALNLPSGKHEVPLLICDRNVDTDEHGHRTGDLLYKAGLVPRPQGGGPPAPGDPTLKLPFLGPYNVVNGVIWPHMRVEARWYRFRILNACNARPYSFELRDENDKPVHGGLVQIGSDGGLLPEPAPLDVPADPSKPDVPETLPLTLQPGERADILIDFSKFRGKTLTLVNRFIPVAGPAGSISLNPDVMQFRVRPNAVHHDFKLPSKLSRSFVRLTHETPHEQHRWVALVGLARALHPEMWEMRRIADRPPGGDPVEGIVQVQVPGPDGKDEVVTLQRVTRAFEDPVAFMVNHHAWEQWNFINLSEFPHPMHIHLAPFQALTRNIYSAKTHFDQEIGGTTAPVRLEKKGRLEPGEKGWKDIIQVGVYELVQVIAQFTGGTGRFVHHCHIFEHEDMGMMRTFVVTPKEIMPLMPNMPGMGHGHDDDHDDHDHDHNGDGGEPAAPPSHPDHP
jgi:o-aminophenol oxidase